MRGREALGAPRDSRVCKGVFGRCFTAAGAPVGGDFVANTYTTGPQQYPGVATDGADDNGVITATDALIGLKTAVGSDSCLDCVCNVNSSGGITVTDSLNI